MKATIFTVTIILLCSCTKYGPLEPPRCIKGCIVKYPTTTVFPYLRYINSTKNIQPIDDPGYEAFGFPVENNIDFQVTHYYSHALTHTTGGALVYRTLKLITGKWSGYTTIRSVPNVHIAGATGGKMDNDSTVIFTTEAHTDGTRDIYIIKADMNNNFHELELFDWQGELR